MSIFDDARAREDLQTLVGSRARGRNQAAVRVIDIGALVTLAPKLQSEKAAGANVTVAEYNALLADVKAMHEILLQVAAALQAKLRP